MSSDETELNKTKQPLLAHLIELRSRSIKAIIMIKYKSIHVNCPADDPRSADHSPQPAASAASAEGERCNCTQSLLFCLTAEMGTGF